MASTSTHNFLPETQTPPDGTQRFFLGIRLDEAGSAKGRAPGELVWNYGPVTLKISGSQDDGTSDLTKSRHLGPFVWFIILILLILLEISIWI